MGLSAVVVQCAPEVVREQACPASVAAAADPRRQRLAGLDGLRGLAALFVVVNHAFLRTFPGYPVDRAQSWAGPFNYGRFVVVVGPPRGPRRHVGRPCLATGLGLGAAHCSGRLLPVPVPQRHAAGALPNVAGWGPRAGVSAWVFGAAGLGVQRGVAAAVVYGVMVLVASPPGAAVLVVAWLRRIPPPGRIEPPLREGAAHA